MEIVNEPFRVTLFGYSGPIRDGDVATSGRQLMDRMWQEVKGRQLANQGINYWVYLPNNKMFTGVELSDPAMTVDGLERLEVELKRYAKHLHVGPYSTLPEVWPRLMGELHHQGFKMAGIALEVYGHMNPGPAKCETTILIGLG